MLELGTKFGVVACLGLVGMVWLATPAAAQGTNAKLAAGEVIITTQAVAGLDIPRVVATAVIKAAPEKVWALIEKCDDYEKTMVNMKFAQELSRDGNKVRCKTTVDLPWPMDDLSAVSDAVHVEDPGKLYSRTWKMVSGDFDFNYGSWKLTPFNGDANQTLVVYTVHVKPKSAVPDSLKSYAQQNALPDLFEHLRKQLEGK